MFRRLLSAIALLSALALLSTLASAGTLTGNVVNSAATVSISTVGSTDWAKWVNIQTSATKQTKSGGPARISNYATVGSQTPTQYTNDPRTISWTGGTPTSSGSDTNGVYSGLGTGTGFGFSWTITGITTSTEIIDFYFGAYSAAGQLILTLTDGSAGPLTLTSTDSGFNTSIDPHFQVTVAADTSTSLTLTYLVSTNDTGGNVTLSAIGISPAGGGTTCPGQPGWW